MFDNVHLHKTVYRKGDQPFSRISPETLPVECFLELPDDTVFFQDCSYCLEGVSLKCYNKVVTGVANEI